MTCKTFRQQHADYLDAVSPAGQRAAMETHLDQCTACARFDTTMRRGLLVLRNLPPLEPSAAFAARLYARLGEMQRNRSSAAIAPAAHGRRQAARRRTAHAVAGNLILRAASSAG